MRSFIVQQHINIDTARKDIDFATGDPYDVDNPEHISEWTAAMVINTYPIGTIVDMDEIDEKLDAMKIQQTLDRLCDAGLVEAAWDGENVVYRAAPVPPNMKPR